MLDGAWEIFDYEEICGENIQKEWEVKNFQGKGNLSVF